MDWFAERACHHGYSSLLQCSLQQFDLFQYECHGQALAKGQYEYQRFFTAFVVWVCPRVRYTKKTSMNILISSFSPSEIQDIAHFFVQKKRASATPCSRSSAISQSPGRKAKTRRSHPGHRDPQGPVRRMKRWLALWRPRKTKQPLLIIFFGRFQGSVYNTRVIDIHIL